MKPHNTIRSHAEFSIPVRCTIGDDCLDRIHVILASHGVTDPLWMTGAEPKQRKAVRKILAAIRGTHPYTVIEIPSTPLSEEERSKLSSHDSIVACGDSRCIEVAKTLAGSSLPLFIVPFGALDGLECQGRIRQAASEHTVTKHVIFDGRLSRLTNEVALARTICVVLLEACTTLLANPEPLLLSIAMETFIHTHKALDLFISSGKKGRDWRECTLLAGAAVHAAGVCAYNRGPSTIIAYTEALAIEGFAELHQAAAALLPYLIRLIETQDPAKHDRLQSILSGMDPHEFVKVWTSLAETGETERIIGRLCTETHSLIPSQSRIRELQSLLQLLSGDQGAAP